MKRTLGLTLVSVALILSILACGGGKSVPTETSAPEKPTAVPKATTAKQPTATEEAALEPTEASAVPTKLIRPTSTKKAPGATDEPTQAGGGGATTVDCGNVADGKLGVAYDRGYKDSTDSWRIIGLICNNSKEAVTNIKLAIEVFDKNDKSLHKEEDVWTALYSIDAGEATPFATGLSADLPGADTYEVTITSFENTTLKRAKVDVQGVLLTEDDNGRVHLTGEVVNNGKEPVKIHGLAAITTDSDGKMEAADYYSVLIHYLSPGKSGPFRVSMGAPKDGPTAKDWTIYLDAEATTSADFLISAADDLTDVSEFFDANGNFHMAAELTNSSQQNIGVRLLATLYDKDGNVLDAAMTDTAISAIAPGEKIPFEFDYWGPVAYKQGVYDAYDKWRVQIDPVWTFSTKTKLVDLTDTIKDDSNTFDDTQGIFKGTVVNSSGGDLDSIVVIVGIWPKKGQPDAGQVLAMGYSYADISDKLAKGKSADFTVYVPIPKGLNIDNYEYGMIAKGHAP